MSNENVSSKLGAVQITFGSVYGEQVNQYYYKKITIYIIYAILEYKYPSIHKFLLCYDIVSKDFQLSNQ